ncbi:hypothetical protein L932_05350 [Helicobacter pylori PZ5026]|nr:hypothetical protein [Helicobacter pylori]EQD90783.1 hypothetical protein L932_05350 [Helicobacter pylori PZ5026]WQU31810.1 hypothetical protein KVE79_06790 [Helicobacter pylori]
MKKSIFSALFSALLCCKSVFAEGETPLIVNDPETHVSQATIIGKMVDSIKRYEEIISKAQAQVNQLQKVNNMINTTNSLISSSAITLANPMQVLQNAQYQLQSIRYNYENLKQSIENWNTQNLLRNKYLSQQCPWLNVNALTNNKIVNLKNLNNLITKNGEQTQTARDVQNLIQSLSSSGHENMQSLAGELSGRDMGLILCEQLIKDENQARYNQLSAEASLNILNGNYQAYKMKIFQQDAMKITERIKKQQEINAKANYLKHRLADIQQQLGVTDSTANHNKQGIHYCKENKENGTCTPLALEKTRLDNELDLEIQTLTQDLSKAPNKDAQSQAYANFNQRIRLLTIKYLKEITNQMLFLNQTMAMQSEIIADTYKTDYGFNTNLKGAKSTQYKTREQILGKVKTNQFGFPEIAPN